jgi:hypothetical protein
LRDSTGKTRRWDALHPCHDSVLLPMSEVLKHQSSERIRSSIRITAHCSRGGLRRSVLCSLEKRNYRSNIINQIGSDWKVAVSPRLQLRRHRLIPSVPGLPSDPLAAQTPFKLKAGLENIIDNSRKTNCVLMVCSSPPPGTPRRASSTVELAVEMFRVSEQRQSWRRIEREIWW